MKASEMNASNSHMHRCDRCGFIWQHSNEMEGSEVAHICPCGGQQFWHYRGHEQPHVRMCGRPRTTRKLESLPVQNDFDKPPVGSFVDLLYRVFGP